MSDRYIAPHETTEISEVVLSGIGWHHVEDTSSTAALMREWTRPGGPTIPQFRLSDPWSVTLSAADAQTRAGGTEARQQEGGQ